MTMKFYYPRPWFIKVNIPATEFTANSVREGTVLLPETGAILQCLLAFSYDHTSFMEKMPMYSQKVKLQLFAGMINHGQRTC